tara:strand:+ start:32144 stop:33001 length:858 start_codon:yes stop_codon:yes gene_type:complete
MGLGGYLTWTAAAREIKKVVANNNVKMLPVEQHGNFLKLIKSPSFYNNSDFFQGDSDDENVFLFPLILNNPHANYCKSDTPTKALHRYDKHIIEQICECYGIKEPELKCVVKLSDLEKEWARDYHNSILKGEKYITIEPFSKDNYTPNRNYPFEKWQEIVNAVHNKIKIVQVGNAGTPVLNNVVDLTGQTSFRQAISVIERSELFLATESGLVHATTAVNTKSIVIITGYQSEKMVAYPQNINVNISSHGPCGLKTECPDCKKDAENYDLTNIVRLIQEELCLEK